MGAARARSWCRSGASAVGVASAAHSRGAAPERRRNARTRAGGARCLLRALPRRRRQRGGSARASARARRVLPARWTDVRRLTNRHCQQRVVAEELRRVARQRSGAGLRFRARHALRVDGGAGRSARRLARAHILARPNRGQSQSLLPNRPLERRVPQRPRPLEQVSLVSEPARRHFGRPRRRNRPLAVQTHFHALEGDLLRVAGRGLRPHHRRLLLLLHGPPHRLYRRILLRPEQPALAEVTAARPTWRPRLCIRRLRVQLADHCLGCFARRRRSFCDYCVLWRTCMPLARNVRDYMRQVKDAE